VKLLISNEFYDLFRGEKDFIIPQTLSKPGYSVSILCPTKLSITDKLAGFKFSKSLIIQRSKLSANDVHFYTPLYFERHTHNKTISFLIPLFSYFIKLFLIRPDVIIESIYTTLTPRSYWNYLYCLILKKKRILLNAGDDAARLRCLPFEKAVFNQASKIFTYNKASVKRMMGKYRAPENKFFVHLKILDPNRFFLIPERINSLYTVAYVGRFVTSKGFDKFIELAQNFRNDKNIQFLAIGINEDHFQIPDSIKLFEYIDNLKMAETYSSIDLLIMPDMRNFKSFATVVQEGLMCGCEVAIGSLDKDYYPVQENLFFFNPEKQDDLQLYIRKKSTDTLQNKIMNRVQIFEAFKYKLFNQGFWQKLTDTLQTTN